MTAILLFILGLALFALLRGLAWVNPRDLFMNWRALALWLGVLGAGVLAATGRLALALPLVVVLFTLVGRGILSAPRRTKGKSRRRYSFLRSAALELVLDPQSGRLSGQVLIGTYKGRSLDHLDAAAFSRLMGEVAGDFKSRALLEAYLDRRMPRWREDMKADSGARNSRPTYAGAMSEEEAYQILGLEKGAGEAEIRAAHRRLMKRVHPDQGGSTFLAARINEAKDRLLSKHR